jgi:hypothetical protein
MPINMSYPKPRDVITKIVTLARADSSTEKCVLPKDAVVCGVFVHQTAAATSNASAFDVGFTGDTDGLLDGFLYATTSVGYVAAGVYAGSAVGTKLTSDKVIVSTCTAGASDTTSTGYMVIQYFIPGPGEGLTD